MKRCKTNKFKARNDKIRQRWADLRGEKKSKENCLDILEREFIDYNLSRRRIEDIFYGRN